MPQINQKEISQLGLVLTVLNRIFRQMSKLQRLQLQIWQIYNLCSMQIMYVVLGFFLLFI